MHAKRVVHYSGVYGKIINVELASVNFKNQIIYTFDTRVGY